MVQLMQSSDLRLEPNSRCRNKTPIKLEIEDALEEEYGPDNKRPKFSSGFKQQWSTTNSAFPIPQSQYNPLDEPSPLGLRLRKSPSLLDLIQMRLSQGSASSLAATVNGNSDVVKKEGKGTIASISTDKLKASNFPASFLRVGRWEYKSRYEGDLVGKCYFAKHKLVWEVLEGGLKSKIEIQWSDIMALKASCPDDGPGTLNVVLARQPLFFRETNPQPRKHTLWQATVDFTDGQASLHRQHFLQCPQGLLNKHFEKLIQCDTRLNFLSRQPEIVIDSPYFETQASLFEEPGESKGHGFDQVITGKESALIGFQDVTSPTASQSSSLIIERRDSSGMASEHRLREAPSPTSGNGNSEAISGGPRNWEDIKVPGMHSSMSMVDLMSHIGQCISGQMTAGNPHFTEEASECQDILEDIAQYLLSDNQNTTASDEKSLMSRVNSLCCLLQKDPSIQNFQVDGESSFQVPDNGKVQGNHTSEPAHDTRTPEGSKDVSSSNMSRKDSFSDLLLHLPRITSLPKFLFNISEEGEDKGR